MNNFSTNKIKPTIIGAGIGGLSLAIGLQKQGIECEIYESTPELNEVGAGIVLANNAMQVYKQFGLYEDLINIGNRISQMEITKPNLKPLSTIRLKTFEEKYDVHGITVHRAHLQRYLSESFSGAVHLNHPLNGLNFHQDGVSLYTLLIPDRASTLFPCFDQPSKIRGSLIWNFFIEKPMKKS